MLASGVSRGRPREIIRITNSVARRHAITAKSLQPIRIICYAVAPLALAVLALRKGKQSLQRLRDPLSIPGDEAGRPRRVHLDVSHFRFLLRFRFHNHLALAARDSVGTRRRSTRPGSTPGIGNCGTGGSYAPPCRLARPPPLDEPPNLSVRPASVAADPRRALADVPQNGKQHCLGYHHRHILGKPSLRLPPHFSKTAGVAVARARTGRRRADVQKGISSSKVSCSGSFAASAPPWAATMSAESFCQSASPIALKGLPSALARALTASASSP